MLDAPLKPDGVDGAGKSEGNGTDTNAEVPDAEYNKLILTVIKSPLRYHLYVCVVVPDGGVPLHVGVVVSVSSPDVVFPPLLK